MTFWVTFEASISDLSAPIKGIICVVFFKVSSFNMYFLDYWITWFAFLLTEDGGSSGSYYLLFDGVESATEVGLSA